jgi:hypothetical protein
LLVTAGRLYNACRSPAEPIRACRDDVILTAGNKPCLGITYSFRGS